MALKTEAIGFELIKHAPHLNHTRSTYLRIYRWLLVCSDASMLALAFVLAYWLRFVVGITVSPEVVPAPHQYTRLVLILIPLWLPLFAALRLYDFHMLFGGTSEYARAFNACTSGLIIVVLATFVDSTFVISRGWLLMSWMLSALFVGLSRFMLRRVAHALWQRGQFLTPAVIIGTNQEAVALAKRLGESAYTGLTLLGFVDAQEDTDTSKPAHLDGLPILGNLNLLPELVSTRSVGEIIVATTAVSREQLFGLFLRVAQAPNVEVRLSSGLYEILTVGMQVMRKADVPLMSLSRLRLEPVEMLVKTILDYLIILLLLPFLIVLFALIALLIRIDSPGPIFYRRRVLGIGGKAFDAFKFRSMKVNGDEILAAHPELRAELESNHKLKTDPRITRVGHFLRRTSLDELPQLINVLLGQMSLVGPRMISPEEAKEYGDMRMNLLTVKPGLTGLWQVSGRSDLSYEDRVRLDMDYIRNYSIWLDIHILFFQTIPVVLKGKGAY